MTPAGAPGDRPPLIAIVGPTAVGKTALSLQIARRFPAAVVSADSRLFYKGMDIGTAKPSLAERAAVPHYLIDICRPDETVSLGVYQEKAYAAIDEVRRAGRLPLLVGGTGQYVMAVCEGWGIPRVPPQPELRAALGQIDGPELARWLAHLDPVAAAKHDPRNVRRVIRALEVTLVSGRPISELQRKLPPPFPVHMIGLTCDREMLYRRIDDRVDQMMADGLLQELEGLRAAGYGRRLPAMSGLGYRQLWAYLDGEMSLADAVERIKYETHRFVRHQYAWFKRDDPRLRWFDVDEPDWQMRCQALVASWLA